MRNAQRLSVASGTGVGSSTNTSTTVNSIVAPMTSNASAVSVSMPIGATDPHTKATRAY